jgi:hypothetical protein
VQSFVRALYNAVIACSRVLRVPRRETQQREHVNTLLNVSRLSYVSLKESTCKELVRVILNLWNLICESGMSTE